jgi:hypothetical protein
MNALHRLQLPDNLDPVLKCHVCNENMAEVAIYNHPGKRPVVLCICQPCILAALDLAGQARISHLAANYNQRSPSSKL